MGFPLRLWCLVCLVVGLLPASALAETRNDGRTGDDCVDQMTRIDGLHVDEAEPRVVEAVVPCAMVESGVLGADCRDAAFYVVNTQGTLLCRIDVSVLVTSTTTDALDDGPPAAPGAHSAAVIAGATVELTLPRIPPPGVADLPAPAGPPGLGRGRDVVGFSPRPS